MNRIHSLLAAGLLLAVVALAWEVPRYLLLGWFFFLLRVLPGVAVDWASVGIGCLAVVLFTVGVHSLGRAWRRQHQLHALDWLNR